MSLVNLQLQRKNIMEMVILVSNLLKEKKQIIYLLTLKENALLEPLCIIQTLKNGILYLLENSLKLIQVN